MDEDGAVTGMDWVLVVGALLWMVLVVWVAESWIDRMDRREAKP